MKAIVVGVDIAKRVFQLHWVEPDTGEIVALQLKREKFLEHFANRSKCLIGMEACGGSQLSISIICVNSDVARCGFRLKLADINPALVPICRGPAFLSIGQPFCAAVGGGSRAES